MNRLDELAERRAHLLARSTELRERMAEHGRDIEYSVGRFEHAVRTVRSIATPPVLLAAAAGLMIFVKPARLLALAGRAVMLATLAKRVGGLFQRRPDAATGRLSWLPGLRKRT